MLDLLLSAGVVRRTELLAVAKVGLQTVTLYPSFEMHAQMQHAPTATGYLGTVLGLLVSRKGSQCCPSGLGPSTRMADAMF
jgi:hypothetical protein